MYMRTDERSVSTINENNPTVWTTLPPKHPPLQRVADSIADNIVHKFKTQS